MLSIATEYLRDYGAEDIAVSAFVSDLMRGDPATFKAGYSRENAIIATADAFGIERERVASIVEDRYPRS